MRKVAVWVFSIIGLCILFLIYDFFIATPTITFENMELIAVKTPFKKNAQSYVLNYAINEEDERRLIENNASLKEALITFKYDNQSFFKDIWIEGRYATPGNLPQIIVGNKPDLPSVWPVLIHSKARKIYHREFRMTVLIDPKDYSDAEIIEILKGVQVNIVKMIDIRKDEYEVLVTLPLAKP